MTQVGPETVSQVSEWPSGRAAIVLCCLRRRFRPIADLWSLCSERMSRAQPYFDFLSARARSRGSSARSRCSVVRSGCRTAFIQSEVREEPPRRVSGSCLCLCACYRTSSSWAAIGWSGTRACAWPAECRQSRRCLIRSSAKRLQCFGPELTICMIRVSGWSICERHGGSSPGQKSRYQRRFVRCCPSLAEAPG